MLQNNNLSGTIPSELGQLGQLTELNIENNALTVGVRISTKASVHGA